jgi:hypothetical protein
VLALRRAALHAFEQEDDGAETAGSNETVTVAVHRTRFRAVHRTVGEAEAAALVRLIEGASFGEVCACFSGPSADVHAASTLLRWLDDGLVELGPR